MEKEKIPMLKHHFYSNAPPGVKRKDKTRFGLARLNSSNI